MPQPYDYLGAMGGLQNIGGAPLAVQNAIFGQQQQQQNDNTLETQAMQIEQAKLQRMGQQAMAKLVTTPNPTPEQVNELLVPIAQADPQAAAAYRQQQVMQQDYKTLLPNPNAQSIGAFMLKHPATAESVGKAWDTMSKGQQESAFRTASDVFGYLNAEDVPGARKVLQAHIDADQAAGMDTSEYAPLIDMLDKEPNQAKIIAGTMVASRVGPEKFAATFKSITEASPPAQREYDWRTQQFGKTAADAWLATQDTKLIPVQQGGSVYAYGPTGGGDPTAAGVHSAPTGNNVLSYGQYKAYAEVQGPDKAAAWARQNGLTVAVANPSEAGKLAPGTRYTTPDGKVFIR